MFLVAGEALVDMIPDPGRAEHFVARAGGSPFNVALALGRLSAPVSFLCPFSGDSFGRTLRRVASESGVDLQLAPPFAGLSTVGFVTRRVEDGLPDYAFYTEGTAGCGLRVTDLPKEFPRGLQAVHVGSFSLDTPPFSEAIDALLDRLPPGIAVSVDPNVRPFLVRDRGAFSKRLQRVVDHASVVKISDEDLEWWRPGLTGAAFARETLERGAGLVVVTEGASGARAFSARGEAFVATPEVEVADTVGAGDTFQAAMLHWLRDQDRLRLESLVALDKGDLQSMLRYAHAAAALNVQRVGCDPPTKAELAQYLDGVAS